MHNGKSTLASVRGVMAARETARDHFERQWVRKDGTPVPVPLGFEQARTDAWVAVLQEELDEVKEDRESARSRLSFHDSIGGVSLCNFCTDELDDGTTWCDRAGCDKVTCGRCLRAMKGDKYECGDCTLADLRAVAMSEPRAA